MKMNPNDYPSVTFRLTQEMKDKLKREAKLRQMTVGALIKEALEEKLKRT